MESLRTEPELREALCRGCRMRPRAGPSRGALRALRPSINKKAHRGFKHRRSPYYKEAKETIFNPFKAQ